MSFYPSFQTEYTHEELVEHFQLHSEEIEFVESFRSEINKQTVAVLLKSLEYLGGFPESLEQIPEQVRIFIANQFNLLWDYTSNYLWESSTKAKHLSQIREFAANSREHQEISTLSLQPLQNCLMLINTILV